MNFMRNVVNSFDDGEINCAVCNVANETAINLDELDEVYLEVAQIAQGTEIMPKSSSAILQPT